VDIETVYELFRQSRDLESQTQLTVFKLDPVLSAFEKRIGGIFSKKELFAVSPPLVKASIELAISERKKGQETP